MQRGCYFCSVVCAVAVELQPDGLNRLSVEIAVR
jgi:hypothetical protein